MKHLVIQNRRPTICWFTSKSSSVYLPTDIPGWWLAVLPDWGMISTSLFLPLWNINYWICKLTGTYLRIESNFHIHLQIHVGAFCSPTPSAPFLRHLFVAHLDLFFASSQLASCPQPLCPASFAPNSSKSHFHFLPASVFPKLRQWHFHFLPAFFAHFHFLVSSSSEAPTDQPASFPPKRWKSRSLGHPCGLFLSPHTWKRLVWWSFMWFELHR